MNIPEFIQRMKPSAYKSMLLGKYKKTDTTPEKKADLLRWNKGEKWRNLTPLSIGDKEFYECGKKSKEQIKKNLPSICRPTVKVNKDTPTLAKNYNLNQLKKAVKIKEKGEYIKWDKL